MKLLQAVIKLFTLASITVHLVWAAPIHHRRTEVQGFTQRRAIDSASFRAKSTINVAGLRDAFKAHKSAPLESFASDPGQSANIHVYEWQGVANGSLYYFTADMDIDCDGSGANRCSKGSATQGQTAFGKLDATQVPYFVIPMQFAKSRGSKNLKPNALGALICGENMYYAIYGDQNGASPQVIGEASILLAKACFPNAGISGNSGHDQKDVLYIVFGTQVPSGVKQNTIDIDQLKMLGDKHVDNLQNKLQIGVVN